MYYYSKYILAIPSSMGSKEKVDAYTRYSVYTTNNYVLDTSLLYAYKAEDIAENEDDDYMRGKVNHALGWYFAANCDYQRAHRTYDKAIRAFERAKFKKGIRNTKVKKAIAYQLQGYYDLSLNIYKEINDSNERTPSLNDKSLLIKSLMKNLDTLEASRLLNEYFKESESLDTARFQYYHMRAIEASINRNVDQEEQYMNLAIEIAKKHSFPKEHFSMLMNLGRHYLRRKETVKAKKYFEEASTIAYRELMHNRFHEPIEKLLQIAKIESNEEAIQYYTVLYKNHLNLIQQKISVNKTIEDNQKSILTRQRKEIQSQNQKIWILTAMGFMGLALLLFSFFYFRKYRKIVEDLSDKNHLLDLSVNEKQTLLQETHHRVKNNLQIIASLLNLQRKYTRDKKLTAALIDGRNRVKSMALIHQLLYQKKDLQGINVRNYVENLMSSLFSSLKADAEHLQFTNNVEPLNLHEDTLLAIGLIINEVVTNSLKYAFVEGEDGRINITLKKEENKLFLSISDNGIGMPADFDIGDKSSFGYSLITSLSKKLDAKIHIQSGPGTTINFDIRKFIETS